MLLFLHIKREGENNMIKYKIDVLAELSKRGYNTAKIRKEKLISEATLTRIRHSGDINTTTLNALCIMLRCQPGDILEVIPTNEEKIKYF